MFFHAVKITAGAMMQIFLLGAIGYFLVKKKIVSDEGLDSLSRLTIDVVLPLLIFYQLARDFSFQRYPLWWMFPLLSLAITAAGMAIGAGFGWFLNEKTRRMQFLNLVGFQNSGYLPLALFAALVPVQSRDTMFIYLFLFLIGFNVLVFSVGAYLLAFSKAKAARFEIAGLISPPVAATLIGLLVVAFGLNTMIPGAVMKPLKMVGDCTLPLALFVVGGNLAQIRLRAVDTKAIVLLIFAKLILLPVLGLWLVFALKVPRLIGLLILVECAVPSATNLSVLVRHHKTEDVLISQGIFYSHIASLITIPLFLSLYFTFYMVN